MLDLKTQTQDLHTQVEQCYYPNKLFHNIITKDEYIIYLEIFYRLHLSIEIQFLKFENDWAQYNFTYKQYYRFNLLKKDLNNLLKQPFDDMLRNFSIDSFAEAIGFLYVLTGSTMGGMLLSSKVEQTPSLKNELSINNYFLGFKENTHLMWGNFMKFLQQYSTENSQDNELIIAGAKKCFKLIIEELENGK